MDSTPSAELQNLLADTFANPATDGGDTYSEIAHRTGGSVVGVKATLLRLKRRLGARSAPHAVDIAHRQQPACPEPSASPTRTAAIALRGEAAALDRLCDQLGWTVKADPDPHLTPAVLRAVADLLDTLEPDL